MREIKFRAWDKDYKYMKHKVMVGNVWDEDNYHAHMIWVDAEDVDYECESGWMNFDEHSNIELMQYAGLRDKNGVEIYDGDIVSSIDFEHNREYKGIVVFDRGGFRVVLQIKEFKFKLPFNSFEENESSLQVLGNIYENPELLEREAE